MDIKEEIIEQEESEELGGNFTDQTTLCFVEVKCDLMPIKKEEGEIDPIQTENSHVDISYEV